MHIVDGHIADTVQHDQIIMTGKTMRFDVVLEGKIAKTEVRDISRRVGTFAVAMENERTLAPVGPAYHARPRAISRKRQSAGQRIGLCRRHEIGAVVGRTATGGKMDARRDFEGTAKGFAVVDIARCTEIGKHHHIGTCRRRSTSQCRPGTRAYQTGECCASAEAGDLLGFVH